MKLRSAFRTRNQPTRKISLPLALALILVLFAFSACGSGGDDTTADDSAAPVEATGESADKGVPTMPAPRFAAPTTMIDATKVAQSKTDATPEPESEPDLAFGEEAYKRLCVDCHGDDGTGVAGKAKTIVGVELDHAAFVDLLRAGGGYGNEHIFGPSKISDDGIAALFAYVRTLSE